jgi:hypothetical protein
MNYRFRHIAYRLLYPFLSLSFVRKSILPHHNFSRRYEEEKICNAVSPGNKVLSGPFEGLQYSILEAAGSVLIPKILGTYEDELHAVLDVIGKRDYSEIIDIGCAEGYYCLGLALKIPAAKMYAYDTDAYARALCKQNIRINNLCNRVSVRKAMDPAQLAAFPFTGKGLIICDCEGYELELFNLSAVKNLSNCDLLIELHDCDYPGLSASLLPLFEQTHKLTLVQSNPDKKVADYPFLQQHKQVISDSMLDERNGVIMYWAFLESSL